MNAQEYILSQLNALKAPLSLALRPKDDAEMADVVLTALMSKKFRKFSIPEKNQKIIRAAIEKNITNKEPIKIVFPFGGYKLWRLEEAPKPDWAELFSIIYFVRWLKPVCALYPQGVIFTFWSEEVVISKLNNIPESDLVDYGKSFDKILKFIKPWIPSNMDFEVFFERSRYENVETFETELAAEMETLKQARVKNPLPLSDTVRRSIEMNVNLVSGQTDDPEWREKVNLRHYAYYNLQERKQHVRTLYVNENITAFTVFFEPNVIPIGSTKTSIVRFWVGVGALQRRRDSFIEIILSLSQIEKTKATWEPVAFTGLEGRNFKKIRVI